MSGTVLGRGTWAAQEHGTPVCCYSSGPFGAAVRTKEDPVQPKELDGGDSASELRGGHMAGGVCRNSRNSSARCAF